MYTRRVIARVVLVALVFVLATSAHSTILNVPETYGDIQQAIDSAANYDTVLVGPGTYYGPLDFKGKLILVTSTDGPMVTTITGDHYTNLVTFTNGETPEVVLKGFTLYGGWIGVLCENAAPTITRNIFCHQNITNWAAISLGGDGYATLGESPAVIINNTIVYSANGGISTFSTIPPVIKNNIIAFNYHYGIHREGWMEGVPYPDLSYNDVYGNPENYQEIFDPGVGTISENPLFARNLQLSPESPCADAGDPDPTYNDPDGSRNDIGALTVSFDPVEPYTVHVPADYPFIQMAIDYSVDGDTILVADGDYVESLNFGGKNIKLLSENGAAVTSITMPAYGVATAGVTSLAADSVYAPQAELMATSYVEPAVIYLPVGSDLNTVISGFTIDGSHYARGVYALYSSAEVRECEVRNCWGYRDGAGLFFHMSAPYIHSNYIHNNVTAITGGGVFIRLGYGYGMARITGNRIIDNTAGNGPAIGLIEGDDAIIERNVCFANTATEGSERRGAIYIRGANIQVVNNTSVMNTVGVSVLDTKNCDVRNNIITGNLKAGFEMVVDYGVNEGLTYDYNDVWNNAGLDYILLDPAPHDISADPIFDTTDPGEFRLDSHSPCIDAGDPDPIYNDPNGSRNDMGAIPYTGVGANLIHGVVSADGVGLNGVVVNLYDSSSFIATTVTDPSGYYRFENVPPGECWVAIVVPLSYEAEQEIYWVLVDGQVYEINFNLTPIEVTSPPRPLGYWFHQTMAAITENSSATETYEDMCDYLERIYVHFNLNPVNPITICSVDPTQNCDQQLRDLRRVLNPPENSGLAADAKAHFTAMLLNVVSDKLAQWAFVSDDSATASQAITYCNELLTDGEFENDALAMVIAQLINRGKVVPSGYIDLSTPDISYRQGDGGLPEDFWLSQNYPNPFNPSTEIEIYLPQASSVNLTVYNLMGQKVTVLLDEYRPAGFHRVQWNASGLATGVYLYQLTAGSFQQSKKMLLIK